MSSQGNLDKDEEFYRHTPYPMGGEDLLTPGAAHLSRKLTKIPSQAPAGARTSDAAGHWGKIIQGLMKMRCRVYQSVNHRDRPSLHELRSSSWLTTRGGYGGEGSDVAQVARITDDGGLASLRPDRDWIPHHVNAACPTDVPEDGDAAGLRHADYRNEEHPGANWSALAAGRYTHLFFRDSGFRTLLHEDFGCAFVHALGPDGHCAKWYNIKVDSTPLMQKRQQNTMSSPLRGTDEINSNKMRRDFARRAHLDLVSFFNPMVNS